MDRSTNRILDTPYSLLQAFGSQAQPTDTVVISIYDVDDATLDVDRASMTFVNGSTWKYAWTPGQTHTYVIDYYNQTLDVHYEEYVNVVANFFFSSSGSGITGSSLATLRKEFLIQIDNYNADDLTGDASSGDLATKSINKALQKMYALIKDSKFLQAYPTTNLVSTSGQDYIELGTVTDLDEIASIQDTTNYIKLVKIPWYKYRQLSPDPSVNTGVPTHYARLFNRIYLYPRPSSAITYTTDYIKTYSYLSDDGDLALIPARYNFWIYSEAEVEWYKMQDASAVPKIVISERDANREIAIKDILSGFNEDFQIESMFGRQERVRRVDQLDLF